MQLVQLFEPDVSQVLYILGYWQLLVDFTLVSVEVLPRDYYLSGRLGDSIYKKTTHTQRMTVKEIAGVDFQHCLGKDWNGFERCVHQESHVWVLRRVISNTCFNMW
jgi:hypothetical protein